MKVKVTCLRSNEKQIAGYEPHNEIRDIIGDNFIEANSPDEAIANVIDGVADMIRQSGHLVSIQNDWGFPSSGYVQCEVETDNDSITIYVDGVAVEKYWCFEAEEIAED